MRMRLCRSVAVRSDRWSEWVDVRKSTMRRRGTEGGVEKGKNKVIVTLNCIRMRANLKIVQSIPQTYPRILALSRLFCRSIFETNHATVLTAYTNIT